MSHSQIYAEKEIKDFGSFTNKKKVGLSVQMTKVCPPLEIYDHFRFPRLEQLSNPLRLYHSQSRLSFWDNAPGGKMAGLIIK